MRLFLLLQFYLLSISKKAAILIERPYMGWRGGDKKQKIFNIMFSLVKNIYRFMNLRNVHHSVARNENLL